MKIKSKMLLKGFAIMLCLNLAVFSLFGCGVKKGSSLSESQNDLVESSEKESVESESINDTENLSTVNVNLAENIYGSSNKRFFRPIGRTFERNNGLACDLSCTGVRFVVFCAGEIKVKFNVSAECYFTVYLNGERVEERVVVRQGDSGTFRTVATIDDYGKYDIEIVKQSQYPMAYCEIVEVELKGSFERRPSERERFIEFYGDSILNGSNIYKGGTSAVTSDATMAFGYLTARSLNADCNIIGRGGMAIYRNGKTDGLADIWDLCGGTESPEVKTYGFGRVPDCVVVEIGTNDYLSSDYTAERYKMAVKEIITDLLSVYGQDIKIIWCYGYNEYVDATFELTQKAIKELNLTESILLCEMPYCALSKAEGGDGVHPDVNLANEMANVLIDFLNLNVYNI